MRTPVPHRDGDVIRLPLPAPTDGISLDGGALDGEPVLSASEAGAAEEDSVPVIVAPPVPQMGSAGAAGAPARQAAAVAPPTVPTKPPSPVASQFLPWLVLGTCAGIAIGILASQLL
jgi:hypothetical protein